MPPRRARARAAPAPRSALRARRSSALRASAAKDDLDFDLDVRRGRRLPGHELQRAGPARRRGGDPAGGGRWRRPTALHQPRRDARVAAAAAHAASASPADRWRDADVSEDARPTGRALERRRRRVERGETDPSRRRRFGGGGDARASQVSASAGGVRFVLGALLGGGGHHRGRRTHLVRERRGLVRAGGTHSRAPPAGRVGEGATPAAEARRGFEDGDGGDLTGFVKDNTDNQFALVLEVAERARGAESSTSRR